MPSNKLRIPQFYCKGRKKIWSFENFSYLCTRNCETYAEIAQLVEHNLAKVGVASSSLVFRSKSKSFEDKIKQNPLKQQFQRVFYFWHVVLFRLTRASARHRPNLEVSLRISTVKLRDTYIEKEGHFGLV